MRKPEAQLWNLVNSNTKKWVKWQRIESPFTNRGIPDVVGSLRGHQSDPVEAWVENKIIKGQRIDFQPEQPAWLMTWPGRTYVLARKKNVKQNLDKIFVWKGSDALALSKMKYTEVPPMLEYDVGNVDWKDLVDGMFWKCRK